MLILALSLPVEKVKGRGIISRVGKLMSCTSEN